MKAFSKITALFLMLVLVGCDSNDNSQDDTQPAGTIVDTAMASGSFNTLVAAVTAEQVTGLAKAATVQGADLDICVVNGSVLINNATVNQAAIAASNGIYSCH